MNSTIEIGNSTKIEKTSLWNELKGLDKGEKLKLISLLSSSLVSDAIVEPKKDRTQEMIDRFCGSWVGDESAEDIIANIENSRMSHVEPVKM